MVTPDVLCKRGLVLVSLDTLGAGEAGLAPGHRARPVVWMR